MEETREIHIGESKDKKLQKAKEYLKDGLQRLLTSIKKTCKEEHFYIEDNIVITFIKDHYVAFRTGLKVSSNYRINFPKDFPVLNGLKSESPYQYELEIIMNFYDINFYGLKRFFIVNSAGYTGRMYYSYKNGSSWSESYNDPAYPVAVNRFDESELTEILIKFLWNSIKENKPIKILTNKPFYNLLLSLSSRGKIVELSDDEKTLEIRDKFFDDESNRDFVIELFEKENVFGNESKIDISEIKTKLCDCDKNRADIESYDEKILTEANRGHWDLWSREDDKESDSKSEVLYARNPLSDINKNGVIAIDFGTKNTVVVYQKTSEQSLAMNIGGRQSDEKKKYENPTVMEFIDLESFWTSYKAKDGRPETEWEDLKISHAAQKDFGNSSSSEFSAYMNQLKQWAGDINKGKKYRIKPIKSNSFTLESFLNLKETDFNPIEIYAYFIGLHINNMHKEQGHRIYLNYYLSFPVTYEKNIREKIIESFEKGLKKSLPQEVLDDEEVMKKFCVHGGVSEPAAYAVCALQEYGFYPEGDELYRYGIFDFGGGTTDYDFGHWKASDELPYNFILETFGENGSPTLGGENLLMDLAFEIFKENKAKMQGKYPFCKGPSTGDSGDAYVYLPDSQAADKNMQSMMEALRPYWENTVGEQKIDNETSENIDENNSSIVNYHSEGEIEEDEIEEVEIEEDEIAQIPGHSHSSLFKMLEELKDKNRTENVEEFVNNEKNLILNNKIDLERAFYEIKKFVKDRNLITSFEEFKEKSVSDENNNQSREISIPQDSENVILSVTLYDNNGETKQNEEFKTTRTRINKFFEEKITDGVRNFFHSLGSAFQNENYLQDDNPINIFLAGNSCKSPLVKKIFDEQIKIFSDGIFQNHHEKTGSKLFDVFPPLGTDDAFKKLEERGIEFDKSDNEKPTGKTGVAFGLLMCRESGDVKIINKIKNNDEVGFKYFLGTRSPKGNFKLFPGRQNGTISNGGKIQENTWYKFMPATRSEFEIYVTKLPECVTGNLSLKDGAKVSKKVIELDKNEICDNAWIFICSKGPHTIEYAVATSDDVDSSLVGKIHEKSLDD